MKKILTLVAVFIVFGTAAQRPEQKEKKKEQIKSLKIGFITNQLSLTTEEASKFWPIYNAAVADSNGFPIMSQVPFVASTGNHDADTRDLDKKPDALAYYYYW